MVDAGSIPSPRHWLVFSALDEVLVDSWGAASTELRLVLESLQGHGVPVIFNSSRTPREISRIAESLHLDMPRIAEDGTVITYPRELRAKFQGMDYERLCTLLDQLRAEHAYAFQGFHDWSVEEIALHTGLKLEVARLIRQRSGSEPFLWEDSPERFAQFRRQLAVFGLEVRRCEHFWRVSDMTSKARALREVHADYTRQWGYAPCTIALADHPDDQAMLAAAEIAVIVASDYADGFNLTALRAAGVKHIIQTQACGALGWAEALQTLLQAAKAPRVRTPIN